MKSKNEYPLISIGIPTYNRNYGIRKTLESIWQQQYPNLEIIISDNCSTDNTSEVLAEFAKEHPEIKAYRQEKNITMIPNFNFVLEKASGKYFMWVADDDTLEPGILQRYVEFVEANPEYSVVSGQSKYWHDDDPALIERGFNFDTNWAGLRVFRYYFKVIYGGIIHGMMRREMTKDVRLRKIIGNDYHFIACLAYLGKIKNFEFVGYHKNFGGTSKSFKEYAKAIGDSPFAGKFPHVKMAGDAFKEVMFRSRVFDEMSYISKLVLAISSFLGVFFCYYGRIFPFSVGGKIKRTLLRPFKVA